MKNWFDNSLLSGILILKMHKTKKRGIRIGLVVDLANSTWRVGFCNFVAGSSQHSIRLEAAGSLRLEALPT
jgi:hypothetical protein